MLNRFGCVGFAALENGLLTDRYLDGVSADSRMAKYGSLWRAQSEHQV